MKKLSFLLIIICLFIINQQAIYATTPTPQEQFLQANEHYKQQEFDKALAGYQAIPNKSSYVFYNMGNCTCQLGNLGQALAYWRTAQRNWCFLQGTELVDNIATVKVQLYKRMPDEVVKKATAPLQQLQEKIRTWAHGWSLLILQLFVLFSWLLLILGTRFTRRAMTYARLPLIFLLAASSVLLAVKYHVQGQAYVVMSKDTKLLSGPDTSYHLVKNLYEGQEGIIAGQSGSFYKITIDGSTGWAEQSKCARV